jgi:hypothetical protein
MLDPSALSQPFLENFSATIAVSIGTDTAVTSISSVVADFVDPGVTVTIGTSTVTLSGKYTSILPVKWYWKDLSDQLQTGDAIPLEGTYLKIVQLDSPPRLTEDCTYTITSPAGTDTFIHTVTLASYDPLRDSLLTALANQPEPTQ